MRVENLGLRRRGDWVLKDVSFELKRGELVGLAGPNGAGKSSLFQCILGFLQPTRGLVSYQEGAGISYLPQNVKLRRDMPLQVRDFLLTGTWGGTAESPVMGVEEALDFFDLRVLSRRLLNEISGGQWARLSLARSLVRGASIYFFDEPFNHLDLEMEEKLGHWLEEACSNLGKTVFLISHDWSALDHHVKRLILLNRSIIKEGNVREVSEFALNWRDPHHHHWLHQGDANGE